MVDNISAPPDDKCVIEGCGRSRAQSHFGHVFTARTQLASERPPRTDPFQSIRPANAEVVQQRVATISTRRDTAVPSSDGPRGRALRAVRELEASSPKARASQIAGVILSAHGGDVTRGAIAQIAMTAFSMTSAAIDAGLRNLARDGKAHKVRLGVWQLGVARDRVEPEPLVILETPKHTWPTKPTTSVAPLRSLTDRDDDGEVPKKLPGALTLGMIAAIVDDAIRGMNTPTVPMIDDIHIAPEFNIDRSVIIAARVKVVFSVFSIVPEGARN